MRKKLRKIYLNTLFLFRFPYNILSFFFNPFYFVRKNLYKSICLFSKQLYGKMLDFGCGCKPYMELFENVTEYIGLDMKGSGHDNSKECVNVYYDGRTIPFEDGYFDSIFSSEVFEHVPNLDEILPELNRVLARGGYMLVTVPFVWKEHEVPYDFNRFSSYGIMRLMEENGFKIVSTKKSTGYAELLFQLWAEYIRTIGEKTRNKIFVIFLHVVFIFPTILLGNIFSLLLPRNNDFFADNILLAQKI